MGVSRAKLLVQVRRVQTRISIACRMSSLVPVAKTKVELSNLCWGRIVQVFSAEDKSDELWTFTVRPKKGMGWYGIRYRPGPRDCCCGFGFHRPSPAFRRSEAEGSILGDVEGHKMRSEGAQPDCTYIQCCSNLYQTSELNVGTPAKADFTAFFQSYARWRHWHGGFLNGHKLSSPRC